MKLIEFISRLLSAIFIVAVASLTLETEMENRFITNSFYYKLQTFICLKLTKFST
jgi:hypothetical protein